MKLQVTPNWKRKRFYPINMEARYFCVLLSQKCLSDRDVHIIKRMGYEIEETTTKSLDTGSKLVDWPS